LHEDPRGGVGGRAGRGDAVQDAVQLVVFPHGGFVETLDERAAVIAGGQDAVVFELAQGFLDRHAAQAKVLGDAIAVDPIAGAQLSRHHQVDDVRDDLVLLFDPVSLGHGAAKFLT
jgi:hypothetical protein